MRTVLFIAAFFCATAALFAEPPITRIVLERTACYGTCPVYKLTVHRSGQVVFAGEEYVHARGIHHGRISAADFARITTKIQQMNFFKLRDRYDGKNPDGSGVTITDLPTRKTSVTKGDQTKTVENYFRGPPELKELEDLIDKVTKSTRWIR